MEVLYTSSDVHKAIKTIFTLNRSSQFRRVAVVAYLGVHAESYLPSPKGLEIICNPEPGATDPSSIRTLIGMGARMKFSDRLHAKVYWSEKGCIITSANISYRALGQSNQKEAGVLIDSNEFDIDRFVAHSEPYDVTQEVMDRLEVLDRKIRRAAGAKSTREQNKGYIDWYTSVYREPWKMGWWADSELTLSKSAIEKSSNEYGVLDPAEFLNVSKNQVKSNEWLLCFEIAANGIKNIEWMYVDFVVPVSNREKGAYEKEYPFQAVQVHKLKQYPIPPFQITKEFRSAFKKAAKQYGLGKIENAPTLMPRKKLLDYVTEYL